MDTESNGEQSGSLEREVTQGGQFPALCVGRSEWRPPQG